MAIDFQGADLGSPLLKIETPTQSLQQFSDAQKALVGAQVAQAEAPTDIQTNRDKENIEAATALQQQAVAKEYGFKADNELLGNYFATFDPTAPNASDRFDSGMDRLSGQLSDPSVGNQFKGRYSPSNINAWAKTYTAPTAAAALAASPGGGVGGASSEAPVAPLGGTLEAGSLPAQVSQMPAPAFKAALTAAQSYKAALEKVDSSSDPDAEWAKQATALGHPEWAGLTGRPREIAEAEAWAHVNSIYPALEARANRETSGLPQPVIPAQVKEGAYGTAFVTDDSDPAHPKVKILQADKYAVAGQTADGNFAVVDKTTGQTIDTGIKGTPGAGRQSVYSLKQNAWLAVHPGDNAGALAYAGGTAAKTMSQAEIEIAATRSAQQDVFNGLPQEQEAQRRKMYEAQYTAANQPPPAGSAPAAAPAAPARPQPSNAAVSLLRAHPSMRAQFDQRYGAGASARFLGAQ